MIKNRARPGLITRSFSGSLTFNLPNWQAALMGVKNNTGNARILCLGDSTTFGTGSNNGVGSNLADNSYPAVLAGKFNADGINSVFQNWIGTGPLGSSQAVNNPRISVGSGWAQNASSLGGRFLLATGVTGNLAFTPTQSVDRFEIYYLQRNAVSTFTYDVNGAGSTIVDAQNAAQNLAVATVSTTLGANTLNINWTSGAQVYILGVLAYSSVARRVDVLNAGWGTSRAGDWSAIITTYNAIQAYNPNLIIVSLGINDWCTGVAVGTYQTNLNTVIAACKARADTLIFTSFPSQQGYLSAPAPSVQDTYVAAAKAVAASNNCPIYDMYSFFGSYVAGNALGYYTDGLHPSQSGYLAGGGKLYEGLK